MSDSNRPKGPGGDDAQEVDIGDVDLSGPLSTEPRGTRPPPLPANLSGPSAAGFVPATPSQPPPYAASMVPQQPAKRSPMLYVVLIGVVLVVGLGGGAVVAVFVRKQSPPPPPVTTATAQTKPSATQGPAVITIPTVDMNDDHDGGQ